MKILRSVTRRGFSVGTAGWFTVLRPNTWFPASRLPGSIHHPGGRSREIDEQMQPARELPRSQAGGQEIAILPHTMNIGMRDRGLKRMAIVVLTAAAITSALLLWIITPR
jgi:hypothetical protein